jgi:hypothetical protein
MPEQQSLPEVVQRLVLDRIDSIAQLEVLLLLHRVPRAWDAAEVGAELRIDPSWAAEQFAVLRERRLLAEEPPGSGRHVFAPGTPELAKAVEALAASYAERRVAVVALLYSQPAGARAFADAFRIRKEDGDG